MPFLLLAYTREQYLSATEREARRAAADELSRELQSTGQYLASVALQAPWAAMCIRFRNGNRFITNGPFSEAREQLERFFLVEVEDLNQALAIAARVPIGTTGTVEIREISVGPTVTPK